MLGQQFLGKQKSECGQEMNCLPDVGCGLGAKDDDKTFLRQLRSPKRRLP